MAFALLRQGQFDGLVCMYHDQGHMPFKSLFFKPKKEVAGVNVSIGLPFLRVSVDHGTGFDIVGKKIASSRSL